MNIFKSWSDEVRGYRLSYKTRELFSAQRWRRVLQHRDQRLSRGFSDRDMWNGGEHIMGLISESLKWYENEGIADWEFKFEEWKKNKTNFGYNNLRQIYADIDNYLNHQKWNWSEGLTVANQSIGDALIETPKGETKYSVKWVDKKTGKTLTDKQVGKRIKDYQKKTDKLYSKATNALVCWSNHAAEFWD